MYFKYFYGYSNAPLLFAKQKMKPRRRDSYFRCFYGCGKAPLLFAKQNRNHAGVTPDVSTGVGTRAPLPSQNKSEPHRRDFTLLRV